MSLVKSTSFSVDEEEEVKEGFLSLETIETWIAYFHTQKFPMCIKNGPPANFTQLWEALESTWASIPVERSGPLVESMPPMN